MNENTQHIPITISHPLIDFSQRLFANIPGILGYFPEDSIVLLGCRRHDCDHEDSQQLSVGPVVRLNIPLNDDCAQAIELIRDACPDVVFALAIQTKVRVDARGEEHSIPKQVRRCMYSIARYCHDYAVPLAYGWATSALCADANMLLTYSNAAVLQSFDESVPPAGCVATIEPIISSASMHALSAYGEIPALNRQEARQWFSALGACTDPDLDDIYHQGHQLQWRILCAEMDISDYLAEIRRNLALVSKADPGATQGEPYDKALRYLAIWLSNNHVRDIAIAEILANRQAHIKPLLELAQRYDGEIRANALCLYTMCIIDLPISYRMQFALDAAEEAAPGHSLTRLCALGYQKGISRQLVESAREGSRTAQTMAQYGAGCEDLSSE